RGQYARSDSLITNNTLLLGGSNVAEVYRASPGAANASASLLFTFGMQQTSASPISIALSADPFMMVTSDLSGESALAAISLVVDFFDPTTSDVLFEWK